MCILWDFLVLFKHLILLIYINLAFQTFLIASFDLGTGTKFISMLAENAFGLEWLQRNSQIGSGLSLVLFEYHWKWKKIFFSLRTTVFLELRRGSQYVSRVVKYNNKSLQYLTAFFIPTWYGDCKNMQEF